METIQAYVYGYRDAPNAVLTITADTSAVFWLDVVSLFPEDTWKGRKNGLRPDLAALVDSLAPRFIRFPGGSFVEGYTAVRTYLEGDAGRYLGA
mgnify:CR=1 FL=1